MKNELTFAIPFSGFTTTEFINCFASTYMYLEDVNGESNYDCKKQEGLPCNSCGNCHNSSARMQEDIYFLFDTMCGRSSLRWHFDGESTKMQKLIGDINSVDYGTEDTVDFLFGFAGYEYRKVTLVSEFQSEIIASINAGKPVILKVKTGEGCFRVITGYDGDLLICPNYDNAQDKPEKAPLYDEIDTLYMIGEKVKPRYKLKDGLERIRQVMESNMDEKLWDGYIEKMGWYNIDGLNKADLAEKQARMKRVSDTMWYTFNCHNFAEVFRHRCYSELQDPAFDQLWSKIGSSYGYTHDLAWALIGLNERADWSTHYACGWGEMVELTLDRIRKNDMEVLDTIKSAIEIIEQKKIN